MMFDLSQLTAGSVWEKSQSRKRYKVFGFGIDTATNNAVVIYQKLAHAEGSFEYGEPEGLFLTRPLDEWFGTVRDQVSSSEARFRNFVPRFVLVEQREQLIADDYAQTPYGAVRTAELRADDPYVPPYDDNVVGSK